jgi:hypothetical protein
VFHRAYVGPAVARDTNIATSCHRHEGLITQAIRDCKRPNQGEEYDLPWKIKTVFLKHSTRLMLNSITPQNIWQWTKVIVKFKGRVIFRQYISIKRERFDIEIYKLCAETGYTHDMRV